MMRPDDVCREYAESGLQIRIKVSELDDDTILVEGTAEALLFVSKLFAAQSEAADDGFHMSPSGPGSAWFAPGSTKGMFIHRVKQDRA